MEHQFRKISNNAKFHFYLTKQISFLIIKFFWKKNEKS